MDTQPDSERPEADPRPTDSDLRARWSALAADRLEGKIGGVDDGIELNRLEGPFFEDKSFEHPLEGRCSYCSKSVDDHAGLLLCVA